MMAPSAALVPPLPAARTPLALASIGRWRGMLFTFFPRTPSTPPLAPLVPPLLLVTLPGFGIRWALWIGRRAIRSKIDPRSTKNASLRGPANALPPPGSAVIACVATASYAASSVAEVGDDPEG